VSRGRAPLDRRALRDVAGDRLANALDPSAPRELGVA
jgi:hypothetical protein